MGLVAEENHGDYFVDWIVLDYLIVLDALVVHFAELEDVIDYFD